MVHYNIQSLANKKDILESELRHFDVISLTETWLDQRTHDSDIELSGYITYRRDREGDSHGGICVFVNNNVFSKQRRDLEVPDIECIWVELFINNRKILIGTFYRPPNSSPAVLASIENSTGLAFDTNARNIILTGDFNLNMADNRSSRKIDDLYLQYDMCQLITDPTHFTENSSSLIDLMLTSNKNDILLSGVGEPFLNQNMRYHCPIYCVLKFFKQETTTYSRHIWLYDRGNYQALSREITSTDWEKFKHKDIDIYANNVTEHLITVSDKHIPNKFIKVRQSDPTGLAII